MKKLTRLTFATFATFTTLLSACSILPQQGVSGTYKGTLPCADCEKIEAELVLNQDKTYQYHTVYHKNQEKHRYIEKGVYEWDANKPKVLRLTNSANLAILIGDHHAELCDSQGNPSQTHKYQLQKIQ